MKRKRHRKKNGLSEKLSMYVARRPEQVVLIAILLFNVVFFLLAAFIIYQLAPSTLDGLGFWASVFYTVTMVLDAGCISFIVADVGSSGVAVIIICLIIVLVGMITFTGGIIGYITNYISDFIDRSKSGKFALKLKDHIVIINWNSRAAEIINDLVYTEEVEDVVVLVKEGKDEIKSEIRNRLKDTIKRENSLVYARARTMGFFERQRYIRENRLFSSVSVVVREGDVLSTNQLNEISLQKARTIIILGRDFKNDHEGDEGENKTDPGNSNVIKSLILVAEMTGSEQSADDQKIVVEVEDEWTGSLVEKIIRNKEKLGKCNICPVPVNDFLGRLMSQLAIMPELNHVYAELFSNRGFYFESRKTDSPTDDASVAALFGSYLTSHDRAIPLSVMTTKEGTEVYYLCEEAPDIDEPLSGGYGAGELKLRLNEDYRMHKKNIIILGHNSSMKSIMNGFASYRNEWPESWEGEALDITVIDDEESLKKNDFYRAYPFVTRAVGADIYDRETIYQTITGYAGTHEGDICVLILSDDKVPDDEIDEKPLTYLIYMDDMLQIRKEEESGFDISRFDIIVEVLDPQNFEAIRSYNSNHVVISNRYLSHMMMQMGEHEGIYSFYKDLLCFDDPEAAEYVSKELYLKNAGEFFAEMPPRLKAHELVRAVYEAGRDDDKTVLMGYFRGRDHVFFAGQNADRDIELKKDDRLIMCSNH